jgi:GntR family transcriptional regulator/MocR family aminotransferase
VLSLERRLALLEWARRQRAYIVEDDYDGEYRYDGRPLPSLQGLDGGNDVIYVGTASKMLFPSLRIGWMVAPPALVRPLTLAKAFCDTGGATLDQLTLADFIEGGDLERHIRRSRVRNASRREALHVAVDRHLGGRATLVGTNAGLHGLLRIPDLPMERELELRRRAQQHGVGVYPAAPYYAVPPPWTELLLGFAALADAEIEEGIRRLAAALDHITGD